MIRKIKLNTDNGTLVKFIANDIAHKIPLYRMAEFYSYTFAGRSRVLF